MSNSNGLITYPIGVVEVCNVLGTNHADVGWVCSRGTLINKWAKYKPVIYPNLIDTTGQLNSNKTWKSSATWWKASDGKCGFTINLRTDSAALVNNWGTDWTYNPPTGGTAAPYRLIDFNYYDHKAVSPVYVTYPSEYVRNQGNDLNVLFNAFYGNSNRLLLTDFLNGIWNSQTQNMYCGVLVTIGVRDSGYSDQMTKISVVNPTPLGSGSTDAEKYNRTVSVPYNRLSNVNEGAEIKIYPFLCQNAYAIQEKPDVNGNHATWAYGVVSCPSEMATIYVVNAWLEATLSNVTCNYGQGGNSVQVVFNYDVTGHNGFSKSNVTPYLYVLDNDVDTSGQYPDYEKKYGRHIISYGSALNNPKVGGTFSINVPDGATRNYTQATLFENSSSYAVVGIDAASYVADYRSRHGSGAAKVTLVMELQDNDGIYGSVTMADVTVGGTY